MKHKHSEIIKAFVDGVECEYYGEGNLGLWYLITDLSQFNNVNKVRIKPEPKPDFIEYAKVCGSKYYRGTYISLSSTKLDADDNLKLIFDGETGDLKNAEVIKNV